MSRAVRTATFVAVALCLLALPGGAKLLSATGDGPPSYSEWSAPVALSSVINLPGNDSGPCISRDGLSLYFNSDRPGGYGGLDLYVSHRASVSDPWGEPENLGPNVNSPYNDNAPTLSSDEHRLYFQSLRPGGFGGADLYVARRHNRRDDTAWQPAENLGSVVNTAAAEGAPVYFEDERTGTTTLYFHSNRPGGLGAMDMYSSVLQADETWGTPELEVELSSPYYDQQAAIRRDGLEMFICSDRPGSIGILDLWVSTRDSTSDPWSTPVNLGPIVNMPAPGYLSRPSLSFDGTVLYVVVVPPDEWPDIAVITRTRVRK